MSWTESVNRGGIVLNAGVDPSQALVAPVPGTQVSVPPPPSTVQTKDDGSSRSLLGVIFGVGVVFLIVIVMYATISNNSDGDDTPSPDSTPTEPELTVSAIGGRGPRSNRERQTGPWGVRPARLQARRRRGVRRRNRLLQ